MATEDATEDVIEFTDDITGETYAVARNMFREFIYDHYDVAAMPDGTDADIAAADRAVRAGEPADLPGFACDFAPGVYRGVIPDCGWVKED